MTALTPAVEITEAPTALYRLFDGDGVLLYVGITDGVKARFAQHAATKPWWPEVARKTVEWHPTREAAAVAEAQAIRAENPARNVQGHPEAQSRTRRNSRRYVAAPVAEATPGSGLDGVYITDRDMRKLLDAYMGACVACGYVKVLKPGPPP